MFKIEPSRRKNVTHELLENYKENLIKFSNLTDYEIRQIWIQPGEDSDISNINERQNLPLYKWLILKFRKLNKKTTQLYAHLDQTNKEILLKFFNLDEKEPRQLISFFHWITNGVSIDDLAKIDPERPYVNCSMKKLIKKFPVIEYWTKENDINFYYNLKEDIQKNLLELYYNSIY